MSDHSSSDEERERTRQSERTIDNLKRLYAVLFALSFGVAASATYSKIDSFLGYIHFDWVAIFVHSELTVAFVITAGLFYYQGDRFLDVVYARAPIADTSPVNFAIDYLVNVLTMTPFYLIAHSLDEKFTASVGFTWYFISYFVLIGFGLALLFARDVHALVASRAVVDQNVEALKIFWMVMNSALLLLVVLAFSYVRRATHACPTNLANGASAVYVAFFGLIIFVRDYLDFTHGWAVLYPVRSGARSARPRPLIRFFSRPIMRGLGRVLSLLLIAALICVIARGRLWDIASIKQLCTIGG